MDDQKVRLCDRARAAVRPPVSDATGSVTDYWHHVILLAPDYDIDVLEGHRHLHDHRAFTPALFDRWLQIFLDTVDGGWTGPSATLAKKRATGMARAMSLRFLGKGAWKPVGAQR